MSEQVEISGLRPNADEVMKLLDAGWEVVMRHCAMGDYYVAAFRPGEVAGLDAAIQEAELCRETSDYTPTKALHRLTEKVLFKRIVGEWGQQAVQP